MRSNTLTRVSNNPGAVHPLLARAHHRPRPPTLSSITQDPRPRSRTNRSGDNRIADLPPGEGVFLAEDLAAAFGTFLVLHPPSNRISAFLTKANGRTGLVE